jgi:hypothetical protein
LLVNKSTNLYLRIKPDSLIFCIGIFRKSIGLVLLFSNKNALHALCIEGI